MRHHERALSWVRDNGVDAVARGELGGSSAAPWPSWPRSRHRWCEDGHRSPSSPGRRVRSARQRPPSARSGQSPRGIAVGARSGGHPNRNPPAKSHFPFGPVTPPNSISGTRAQFLLATQCFGCDARRMTSHLAWAGKQVRGVVYLVDGDQLVAMERSLYDAEDVPRRNLSSPSPIRSYGVATLRRSAARSRDSAVGLTAPSRAVG
jgi:hypothetical protein